VTLAHERLAAVRERIDKAAARAGRPAGAVRLLAVSKLQGAEAVAELARAGCRLFGENYVQEAREKQALLEELHVGSRALEWHLIGPLQSNKAGMAVELFDWIHSVDRLSLAEKLSRRCEAAGRRLSVLVQVNTSGEPSKHGVAPEGVLELCRQVARLEALSLRGLMCVPQPAEDPDAARPELRALARLLAEVRSSLGLSGFDELSMGMSADLEAAVEEGATIVRVGTALFGPRPG
jgi:PLP dependent protein